MNPKLKMPVNRLLNICLETGMVPDAKFHYRWDEYAQWQIDGLIEIGMKPNHKLLDIGCGPLRLGTHAIDYLEDGNFYGIDANPAYLELAPIIYKESGLTKKYHIILDSEFNFTKLGSGFDFAIAQSVFTHLSSHQIIHCLKNLKGVMNKDGTLLFTNIITDYPRGFLYAGKVPMISGTHCTVEFYKQICAEIGATFIEKTISHPTQTAHLIKF